MHNRIDQLQTGREQPKPRTAASKSVSANAVNRPGQLTRLAQSVEEHIGQHPAASLGVGLVIGALVGWLIKRK